MPGLDTPFHRRSRTGGNETAFQFIMCLIVFSIGPVGGVGLDREERN